MKTNPVLVVGGGPVGLIQALYLSKVRKLPVVVIEQQAVVGGLYASRMTPWGCVDQGVHIPSESGESALDELFFAILPEDQWHILDGVRKDIAGNYFEGRLDHGSLYPDLRRLPREDYIRCLGDLFANVTVNLLSLKEARTLEQFIETRFGSTCTRRVFEDISQKFWRQPLERLSPMAAKIVHLTRVVTHDACTTLALKESKALDDVIGFPDQLSFPSHRLSNRRRALYPREFGLSNLVDGLRLALQREGVRVLTSSSVAKLELSARRITAAQLTDARSTTLERLEVLAVVWTSPLPPLVELLGSRADPLPDAPISHRVVHLFLDRPPQTGELYWLWSYDPSNSLIRVSSPHSYCSSAARSGLYPLCAEMHVSDASLSDSESMKLAEYQLRAGELIGQETAVVGASVLPGIRNFFVPTIANCNVMAAQRHTVIDREIANLVLATQNIGEGVFYMPDILKSSLFQLNDI